MRKHVDVQAEMEGGLNFFCDLEAETIDVTQQVTKCVKTVSEFAEAVDWRPEIPSVIDADHHDIVMTVSENDQALHAGSYIKLNVLPKERFMRMQGCYYDAFHQPVMLCEAFFPLANTTPQELESSLKSMRQILEKYHRTFVTPSARSRI